jgi:hypothetical protein
VQNQGDAYATTIDSINKIEYQSFDDSTWRLYQDGESFQTGLADDITDFAVVDLTVIPLIAQVVRIYPSTPQGRMELVITEFEPS